MFFYLLWGLFGGEFAQGSDYFSRASQAASKFTLTLPVALEGTLGLAHLEGCVGLERPFWPGGLRKAGPSMFSGMLQPTCGEQRKSFESPGWKRGRRAAGQRLLARLQGPWGLCTVAGLFALQTERYTNTSCFVYSHTCPVHSAAPRAGLANPGIQQAD